jgi:hypothetical protein
MARFRGTVRGSARSEASRTGTVKTGLQVEAGSWSGGVYIDLYVDSDDNDCCRVGFKQWVNGAGKNVLLYDGRVDEPTEIDKILLELHEARMVDFEDVAPPRKRKIRKGGTTQ